VQAYPHLPQPRRNKEFPSPLLNSVERKPLVKVSAALIAEQKCRKAVGALPLKWSRLAASAHCCSWDTLRIEEAAQVRANFRNKLLHEGTLGLGPHLMTLKKNMWLNALSSVRAHLAPLSRMFRQHPYPWMGGWLPAILPDGHPPPC
jgi:hypothetical protein